MQVYGVKLGASTGLRGLSDAIVSAYDVMWLGTLSEASFQSAGSCTSVDVTTKFEEPKAIKFDIASPTPL